MVKPGRITRKKVKVDEDKLVLKLKRQKKYKTWEYRSKEERILEAIRVWKDPAERDITNLHIACRVLNVPYSTTYNRNKGAHTLEHNGGHNTRLGEAQEASLIWYVDVAVERGMPLRLDHITKAATSILKAHGVDVQKNPIGLHWAERWVQKQDQLGRYHSVTTTPLDHYRKAALTPEMIHDYLNKLNFVIRKYGIQVCDMYNMDETGFRVGIIKSTTVITHKNIRHVSAVNTSFNTWPFD